MQARRWLHNVIFTLAFCLAFMLGSAYVWFLQPVVAAQVAPTASEPEPQECYIWAVDTETDREFLLCPDPDNGNVCYENMAELMDNAVKFFTCQAIN